MSDSADQDDDGRGGRGPLRPPALSVRNYRPDYLRIYGTLFGKEPTVDQRTGELVFPQPGAAPAPPRPPR